MKSIKEILAMSTEELEAMDKTMLENTLAHLFPAVRTPILPESDKTKKKQTIAQRNTMAFMNSLNDQIEAARKKI